MNKKYTAVLLAAAISSGAMAQSLNKEIVTDRDVEPAERAVTRPLALVPDLYSAPVRTTTLRPWEYTSTGTVRRQLSRLEPAAFADTFAISPYRGYASIGYLPAFNLGASAGYRLINTASTHLGAWLQYSGMSYKMPGDRLLTPQEDKASLNRHAFTLGVDLSQRWTAGTLDADAAFTYGSTGQPYFDDNFTQSVTAFDLDLDWRAATEKLPWHLGLSFNTFGFGKNTPLFNETYDIINPRPSWEPEKVRENIVGGRAGIMLPSGNHAWGLDVDARFQILSGSNALHPVAEEMLGSSQVATAKILNIGSRTYSVTRLTPYYSLTNHPFNARLGVNVDISSSGSNGVKVAPEVELTYAPSQQFSVWGKATGGRQLNTLASLYNRSPYMNSELTYSQSTVNVDASLGINIGPLAGFSASAWVGYSDAGSWLAPVANGCYSFYAPHSTTALRYGIALDWQYRSIVTIHLGGQGAQNNDHKSYYAWNDAARWVVDASLKVTPIKPLDIAVSWEFRSGRHGFLLTPAIGEGLLQVPYWQGETCPMGVVSNLSASARYRLTDAFSIFANVENILGRRWQNVIGIDEPGVNGLVGVAYKF